MKSLQTAWVLFLFPLCLQSAEFDPNVILVQLHKNVGRSVFASTLNPQKYEIEKVVVKRLGIYRIRLADQNMQSAPDAVNELRANPWVQAAQLDHKVTPRETIPDDPEFSDQWSLKNTGQGGGTPDADIDAPEAWDITTSGVTLLGDTIVVAVVDGGMMLSHSDLEDNLWVNRGEIPGNNIDDDGNGYVDDVNGWDAYSSDGSIPSDGHGTHVGGIVSARGNNGLHVSGVNWEVKLMAIAGSSSNTSTVLEAYGYALDQRIVYDSSNGGQGAFVVATNSSFGVDFADCSSGDYVLWDNMYTALGEAGILSAAATINSNANVDTDGDVPTGCESEYLVTVTNTTRNDAKNSGAAYGATTIDLGAPGSNILSTYSNGSTSSLTGTSMATPHVAGAIGFLHAAASNGFAQYYKNSPADAALDLKEILLAGVDTLGSLEGITVSGGRLNLYNSALLVNGMASADSLDPNPVSELSVAIPMDNKVVLTWVDPTHLAGGYPISSFFIKVVRDDQFIVNVNSGTETFTQESLPGNIQYSFSLITTLTSNDSTSIPAIVRVTPTGEGCMRGDATLDGRISIADPYRVLQFILGYREETDLEICTSDVDFDGTLTIFDFLLIVDIMNNQP
jgi:hypothetical protein